MEQTHLFEPAEQTIFPVITLYQPWATWIIRGWKEIETRLHARFKSLNGKTILIHAGQKTDVQAAKTPYLTKEQILFQPDEVINGYILGSAFVHATRPLTVADGPRALIECESMQRYGLELSKVKKFDNPIAVNGDMGIWYFDLKTMQKVRKHG
jgi:hypothetical protein